MKVFFAIFSPALLVLLLIGVYASLAYLVIHCDDSSRFQCQKLSPAEISELDHFSASELLIRERFKEIDKTPNAGLPERIVTKLRGDLKAIKDKTNAETDPNKKQALKTEQEEIEKDLVKVRKYISENYSRRLITTFLVAVSLVLYLSAWVVGLMIIWATCKDYGCPFSSGRFKDYGLQWFTASGAFLFAFLIAFVVYQLKDTYMAIQLALYGETVYKHGLSSDFVNFSNVLGFGAIAILVLATCAVNSSVYRISRLSPPDIDAVAKRMRYLHTLLYISTAMLFLTMLRLSAVMQWHVSFVSEAQSKAFVNQVNNFMTALLSVEGGFYTLLLAAMYLPAAYYVRNQAREIESNEDTLKKKGLAFNLAEFTPRLAILTPFISAAPLAEILKYFSK